MNSSDTKARRYFGGEAADDFDAIYDNEGGLLTKFINRFFRRGMRERVELTLHECERRGGRALDIGCGSGRVSIMIAKRGVKVVGVDYSQRMIELAKGYLEEESEHLGRDIDVNFITADFMGDYDPGLSFDVTIALGVFDYVSDPVPFLSKMRRFTKGAMIAAFPDKHAFQMPLRKLWLWKRGCPVFFYSSDDVKRLYREAGIADVEITKVSAGFYVRSEVE